MKIHELTFLYATGLLIFSLFSCTDTLESKIAGTWVREDGLELEIGDGTIIVSKTGRIFADYSIVDKSSIRVHHKIYPDRIIIIEHSSESRMVWRAREGSNEKTLWWFTRNN